MGAFFPSGIAVDNASNLYIADTLQGRIREVVNSTGIITTVAGSGSLDASGNSVNIGYSGDGGPATDAQLNNPQSVALDAARNLYIADAGNFVCPRTASSLLSRATACRATQAMAAPRSTRGF